MHTDSQWLTEHPAMRESVTTVIEEDIYSLKRAQGKFPCVFLWALMVMKPAELEFLATKLLKVQ